MGRRGHEQERGYRRAEGQDEQLFRRPDRSGGSLHARWIEYAFSSSLMIVLIAMITGIADVVALVALFGVNASMILFGLLQEHYEAAGRPEWLPFIFGCIARGGRGSASAST